MQRAQMTAGEPMADNILYYGDNLDILRDRVRDESVDLVYLDPPFNSNASYNVLFSAQDGTRSAAQIKAFEDTWRWDQAAAYDYQQTVEAGGQVSQALQAFHTLLASIFHEDLSLCEVEAELARSAVVGMVDGPHCPDRIAGLCAVG